MTFKGDKIIGKPTLMQIEIYIAEKGLFCEPQDAYDYWESKEWMTKKNKEPMTLESAINIYNSIAINRATKSRAKELGITKLKRNKKKSELKILRKSIVSGGLKGLDNQIKIESFDTKKKEVTPQKEHIPYEDQLKDKRWESFRTFIFSVRGNKCEICGGNHILQVHHPKYKSGRLAWEYTCNEVMVVCKHCHEIIHHKRT